MAKKDYEKTLSEALGGKSVKGSQPKSLSDALRSAGEGSKSSSGGGSNAHRTTNMRKAKFSG